MIYLVYVFSSLMGELYLGKIYKRFFASLLDYVLVFGLAISFFLLLSNGLIDIGFHNEDLNQKVLKLQEKSNLFEVSKDGDIYLSANYLTYDLEDENYYKVYLKAINDYYYNYLDKEDKSNRDLNLYFFLFNEKTMQNSIFLINSLDDSYEEFILKDEVTNVSSGDLVNKNSDDYKLAIANFFIDEEKGIYNLALTSFTSSEEFLSIENKISNIEYYEFLITYLVSCLIIFLPSILINKNSESLFMHILKIGYTNIDGYKVNYLNKILRIILLLIINLLSIYTYFIPLIINGIIIFINKEKRSLIDICSNEVCVDLIHSTIYKNYEEMEKDK